MSNSSDSARIEGAALTANDVSYAVGMAQLLEAVSLEVRGGSLLGLIWAKWSWEIHTAEVH